ncbi:hypothetical protein E2C01_027278 [Portunus trituberculatus]|uniref:Uncharacterized protein n=1 Tax=Portunus trituberculatus TaxID=210409 RepID=A0A5B7EHG9_PORTR|nr:hypothetical protein [Portunus trituberculatus]
MDRARKTEPIKTRRKDHHHHHQQQQKSERQENVLTRPFSVGPAEKLRQPWRGMNNPASSHITQKGKEKESSCRATHIPQGCVSSWKTMAAVLPLTVSRPRGAVGRPCHSLTVTGGTIVAMTESLMRQTTGAGSGAGSVARPANETGDNREHLTSAWLLLNGQHVTGEMHLHGVRAPWSPVSDPSRRAAQ